MTPRLTIDPTVDPDSRAKIERQLDFGLSSIQWQLQYLDVDVQFNGSTPATYVCRLQAGLRGGRRQEITVSASAPEHGVADAAARLRRVVIRDRQPGLRAGQAG